MDFPIIDLMDQEGCRKKLFDLLHPDGFACPSCGARDGLNIHRRRPDSPVVDFRCRGCRRVFNMFTATSWQGTHLSPAQILLILRGIAQGVPTAKLAREVGISRQHLLRLRHAIQARARRRRPHAVAGRPDRGRRVVPKCGGKKDTPRRSPPPSHATRLNCCLSWLCVLPHRAVLGGSVLVVSAGVHSPQILSSVNTTNRTSVRRLRHLYRTFSSKRNIRLVRST